MFYLAAAQRVIDLAFEENSGVFLKPQPALDFLHFAVARARIAVAVEDDRPPYRKVFEGEPVAANPASLGRLGTFLKARAADPAANAPVAVTRAAPVQQIDALAVNFDPAFDLAKTLETRRDVALAAIGQRAVWASRMSDVWVANRSTKSGKPAHGPISV